MTNPSPLRYPGGKYRLSGFFSLVIQNLELKNCTYVEPFAGGAGAAFSLLFNGTVERIFLNDCDPGIYSFWYAVRNEPDSLIEKISSTPVTIEEWHRQRRIFLSASACLLDRAFAVLFLNRTNLSGILNAGPIGGYAQAGKWKLDVRFHKETLIAKIQFIARFKDKIFLCSQDAADLIQNLSHCFQGPVFYYLDPPYFGKGKKLYRYYYSLKDHQKLCNVISKELASPWILTCDDSKEICNLYSDFTMRRYDLTYSASNKGTHFEYMFFSHGINCPTPQQLKDNKIFLNLRE